MVELVKLIKPKKWIPWNYQLTAASFLISNPFSGLFLDPGLGKTSISLLVIRILKHATKHRGVLLIAPLRVIYNVWPKEIEKWLNFAGITYTILHKDNKDSIWNEQKDIYLINPEGLEWLYEELMTGLQFGYRCPFTILKIDESTKFKNPEAKSRFALIKDMIPLFGRRHIMTGTPAPKSLLDIWSQAYILDEGGQLGNNFYKYKNKYFTKATWSNYRWDINDFAEEQIHDAIAPLILDMSADDCLVSEPVYYNNIFIDLPPKAMKYYKKMEKEFFISVKGMDATAKATAQASQKCWQIANGQVYEDIPELMTKEEISAFKKIRKTLPIHTAKIDALADLVEELAGKPLLVAYYFQHDLKALRKLLGKNVAHIGKGTTEAQTEKIIEQWNEGKIDVLIAQMDGIAHGLNMQVVCRNVAWFSLTWNLETYVQFIKRVARQGVSGSVMVHHLIANNTLDMAMLTRLGERAKTEKDLRVAIREYRNNLTN